MSLNQASGAAPTSSQLAKPAQAVENPGELVRLAADPGLSEDLALALLARPDFPPEALEALSKNGTVVKTRKVRVGIVGHPNTRRHVSLPLLRHLYTFDLMQVALKPIVPADVKRAAEEILANKLESISSGARLTLARRASARIAGQLLADKEMRVMQTALENSRLTEALVVKALARHDVSAILVEALCRHAKWSLRREVRIALLRSDKTPLARALEFARALPMAFVREILQDSRLPASTKTYIMKEIEQAR